MSCSDDDDCNLDARCIDGACSQSYCSPTGTIAGVEVQQAAYGGRCQVIGPEDGRDGYCFGPQRIGAGFGGVCVTTGTLAKELACDPHLTQNADEASICDGVCYMGFVGGESGYFCGQPCHPGECPQEQYCAAWGWTGLFGVCLTTSSPLAVGTECPAANLHQATSSCGEARLCVIGTCRKACDLSGYVGCDASAECVPFEYQGNQNLLLGYCT